MHAEDADWIASGGSDSLMRHLRIEWQTRASPLSSSTHRSIQIDYIELNHDSSTSGLKADSQTEKQMTKTNH